MSPRREQSMLPAMEPRTYYDQPVLKEPVWKWEIPAYFFAGGLAGGSALASALADLLGQDDLARRLGDVALVATAVSGGLLVADLGQPRRFHHMLRVAKPSSPMSMGAWLLGAFATATGAASVADRMGASSGVRRIPRLAGAVLGPLVASYTAVLISDTAIPAWHDAHRELPFLFTSGAAASAGAMGLLVAPHERREAMRALTALGAATEIAAVRVMRRHLGRSVVGEVYDRGAPHTLGLMAEGALASGALLVVFGGRSRSVARVGAVVALIGALLERFAVVQAGRDSARDPKYVVTPQRQRMEAPMTTAGSRPNDVIAAVLEDHQKIKSLMNQIPHAGTEKRDLFRELVATLAMHETAEEEIVHPLARRAENGDEVVEPRLEEEDQGKKALAHLEEIGVDDARFDAEFAKLKKEVLRHAQNEEQQEHPRLEHDIEQEQLQRAGRLFRKVEQMGPTHAHAAAPESATGNVLVGTFVAVADRVRDAIHSARNGD
jgi:formate-dependent nitrite reductase membrane component NrfD/hemerythrin superfamily protein